MKNYLKDKRVLVGLVLVGAVAYYLYDQKRKAQIKARAEVLANTPATTMNPEKAIKLQGLSRLEGTKEITTEKQL